MPTRRNASAIHWVSPGNEPCTLVPMSGGAGLLEIELDGDLVAVHSRNCLLRQGDDEDGYRELAEYEFAVSLQRCQIDCRSRIAKQRMKSNAAHISSSRPMAC